MSTSSSLNDGSFIQAFELLRYGDARDLAHELCEPEVVDKIGEVWGIDEEGELNGVWRDSGHPHLFFAQGETSPIDFSPVSLIKITVKGILS